MPCRVCGLLDRDFSLKKSDYCEFCKAYICKDDQTNILRRARAALIDLTLTLE